MLLFRRVTQVSSHGIRALPHSGKKQSDELIYYSLQQTFFCCYCRHFKEHIRIIEQTKLSSKPKIGKISMVCKKQLNIDFILEIFVVKCHYYKNIDFTFKIFSVKLQHLQHIACFTFPILANCKRLFNRKTFFMAIFSKLQTCFMQFWSKCSQYK